jgi:hypothetical protein
VRSTGSPTTSPRTCSPRPRRIYSHRKRWVDGGPTDLATGVLLCAWHHARAHDQHYDYEHLPDGTIRFHQRT